VGRGGIEVWKKGGDRYKRVSKGNDARTEDGGLDKVRGRLRNLP